MGLLLRTKRHTATGKQIQVLVAGREPPHARHTFEVLPPETRPHKIDLSGRKSWCESDDPAFAAKAADIVRLYMARPRAAWRSIRSPR